MSRLEDTNQFLDLENIFSLVSHLRYVAIKIDAPGFTKAFPKIYPVGRDVDVVCHPEDFDRIVEICDNNIAYPKDFTKHVIRDGSAQTRLRIHSPEYFLRPNSRPTDKLIQGRPWTQLHFQIDITTTLNSDYENLTDSFLNSLFDEKEHLNGVKILSQKKESVFRLLSYEKSRKQSHHTEYLLRHANLEILEHFKNENFMNSCRKILIKLFDREE